MTLTRRQNVLVVGGGVSGVTIARGLSKKLDHSKYNLILIEPRPRHIWLPATVRMVVTSDEKFVDNVVVPLDRIFAKGKGTIKHDNAVGIKEGKGEEESELELASGETLQYRGENRTRVFLHLRLSHYNLVIPALVLATGSKWSGPLDFPDGETDLRQFVSQWRERFRAAPDVVIVGGGAVGIELSGEIRDEYAVCHVISCFTSCIYNR